MADPGAVSDDPARAGCGSGQAWLLRPLGSRAPGTGSDRDSACAIGDPESSPQRHRGVRQRSLARFGDTETWIDRDTTSSTAVQRSRRRVIFGAAFLRAVGHWDFVWDF